jgi:phage host-nuclease inhibitor protein Gam
VVAQNEPLAVVAPEGGLRQLVDAERRQGLALAAVEQEASALVRSAHEDAARESARLDQRIAADLADLAARIEAMRDAEIASLAAAAERYCRALDALTEDAVDQLAAEAEARLLAPDSAESAP